MESRNRNVWVIVFVFLAAACLCTGVAAVAAVTWYRTGTFDIGSITSPQEERFDQVFDVGEAPVLQIDNFAGRVLVNSDEGDSIHVIAIKEARRSADLKRIELEMAEVPGGLSVKTKKPFGLTSSSVRLEITAPRGTEVDIQTGAGNIILSGFYGQVQAHTGAGSIELRALRGPIRADSGAGSIRIEDVTGDIVASTGSGSIDVSSATGQAQLDTGSGSIEYQGVPQGNCRFETGTGGIRLILPSDLSLDVDLDTGTGNIDLDGFQVEGTVRKQEVRGRIGDRSQGSIYAHTGTGSIDLVSR